MAKYAGVTAEQFEAMSAYWQNRYRVAFHAETAAKRQQLEDEAWAARMNRAWGGRGA